MSYFHIFLISAPAWCSLRTDSILRIFFLYYTYFMEKVQSADTNLF